MIKFYIFFILSLLPFCMAKATHLVGYDISYEPYYSSNNANIQITIRLYRNCSTSTRFSNNLNIRLTGVYNRDCINNYTAYLAASRIVNESCNAGDCIGNAVEEASYKVIIPSHNICDSVFTITNEQCCRLSTISNIQNPITSQMIVRANININHSNTSPVYNNIPWVIACAGKPLSFAQEVTEIDGDSLHFQLIPSSYNVSTDVDYNSTYSYLEPLITESGFSINSNTGLITFTPQANLIQNAIVTIRISEYRNGILLGYQDREIYFLIQNNCANEDPYIVEIKKNNTTVNLNDAIVFCQGEAVNLSLKFEDIDAHQIITLEENFNLFFPNARITIMGTNPLVCNVIIPAFDLIHNQYIVNMKIKDNNCPIRGVSYYSLYLKKGGIAIQDNPLCRDSNALISLAANYATYQWSTGETTATILPNGIDENYAVTVTDNYGCINSHSFTLRYHEPIYFTLYTIAHNCQNLGSISINSYGNNYNYTLNNIMAKEQDMFINLEAGVFDLQVIDSNGCYVDTLVNILYIEPNAILPFPNKKILCEGEKISLGFLENYSNFSWSTHENTPSIITDGYSNMYSVTFTDLQFCERNYTFDLSYLSKDAFTIKVVDNLCHNDTRGEIILTPNNPDYNFSYSINNNALISNESHFENLPTGVYTLTITENNLACTIIIKAEINAPNPLKILAEGISTTCNGFSDAKILLAAIGGIPIYEYSLDKHSWRAVDTFFSLSIGDYAVYVRDKYHCIDSAIISLYDAPPFFIQNASPNTTIVYTNPIDLVVELNDNNQVKNQNWYNLTLHELLDSNSATITVEPYTSTLYKYVAISHTNCVVDTIIHIHVQTPRYVNAPNTFTPDGDLHNDKFFIQGNENMVLSIKAFRVYDRWGDLLFENINIPINKPQYGWDGSFKGKQMSPGVFAWYAEVEFVDGIVEPIKGDVTLLR